MIDSDGNITPAPNIEHPQWIGWRPNEPAPESLAVKQMRIEQKNRNLTFWFLMLCFASSCCLGWIILQFIPGPWEVLIR